MKKTVLAFAAAVALSFGGPLITGLSSTPAAAQTVVKKKVVIKHGDRGRHLGWRHSRGHAKKVVMMKRHGHHHTGRTVIKKKTIVR